jgi:acyl-coenzyme A synthetase/AMP-(fatty) acid ligase
MRRVEGRNLVLIYEPDHGMISRRPANHERAMNAEGSLFLLYTASGTTAEAQKGIKHSTGGYLSEDVMMTHKLVLITKYDNVLVHGRYRGDRALVYCGTDRYGELYDSKFSMRNPDFPDRISSGVWNRALQDFDHMYTAPTALTFA